MILSIVELLGEGQQRGAAMKQSGTWFEHKSQWRETGQSWIVGIYSLSLQSWELKEVSPCTGSLNLNFPFEWEKTPLGSHVYIESLVCGAIWRDSGGEASLEEVYPGGSPSLLPACIWRHQFLQIAEWIRRGFIFRPRTKEEQGGQKWASVTGSHCGRARTDSFLCANNHHAFSLKASGNYTISDLACLWDQAWHRNTQRPLESGQLNCSYSVGKKSVPLS